jgi:predicted ester cyclase
MGVPATSRKVCIDGVTIHQISNGKIMDSQVSWDVWGMMQQLGVVSGLGQPQKASAS